MKTLQLLKLSALICLTISLLFVSSVFGFLLFGEWKQYKADRLAQQSAVYLRASDTPLMGTLDIQPLSSMEEEQSEEEEVTPAAALLEAPLVLQNPELPRGCEITSLTMLLNYYGIDKTKLELADEMVRDTTPIKWAKGGGIEYWGHPNDGFVGEITRKAIGFGIYHRALFVTLQDNIPEAIDLTGEPFSVLESYIAKGSPVVAWTTLNYTVPKEWVEWDTPSGQLRTTYQEHAVLLTGYDEEYVYLNDPLKTEKNVKIKKEQFISSWEAMDKQALSYTPDRS